MPLSPLATRLGFQAPPVVYYVGLLALMTGYAAALPAARRLWDFDLDRAGSTRGELMGAKMTLSRARASAVVESAVFQRTVLGVIVVNAIALGLARYDGLLGAVEVMVVVAFSCEILLRLYARGRGFVADPWNWFDLIVVGTAIVPATNAFSVLRILRVLGLIRVVSVVRSLRRVVSAMLAAIPGIGSTIAMLFVALYSGALLGTHLFRDAAPEYFGDLERSLFTMFEIMTVENWPGVAEPILDQHPAAALFFVAYIVLTAFILLNLLIGVIVSAMEIEVNRDRWQADQELERRQYEAVMTELEQLRATMARLEERLPSVDSRTDD